MRPQSDPDLDEELALMEAKSFVARAEAINCKIRARQTADMVLVPIASAVAFALIASSFIFAAMPESNRMTKAQQENVSYAKR